MRGGVDLTAPTAATRVAAVIGSPVRHSLSPTILNAAFSALGLDWVHAAFEVAPGHGASAVGAVRVLGLEGLNVTMPHKVTVADAVDRVTPVAEALGAVNCVFRDGSDLVGDNTDGDGFVDALRAGPAGDPAGQRCAVIGAGGAGRSVARALGQAGAEAVVVVNRSADPAHRAAELAGPAGRVGEVGDVPEAEVVVNATPLGMGPGRADADDASLPFDPTLLHNGQVVVDLIYAPPETALLRRARGAGAVTENGLGMLIYQAARALHRWTGREAPIQVMLDAARDELDRRARFDG